MSTKIKSLKFVELEAAEKCASAVRKNYEDKVIMYRGIDYNALNENEKKEQSELSKKLAQVNAVRLNILTEMEKKLLSLEYDD